MEIKNQVGDIGNKLDRIHDNSLPLIMERRLACASYSRKKKIHNKIMHYATQNV